MSHFGPLPRSRPLVETLPRLRPAEIVFGKLAMYPFPIVAPYQGEMCKLRPVILVGTDPKASFEQHSFLRAIPLSSGHTKGDDDSAIELEIGGESQQVVTGKLATINSRYLKDHPGVVRRSQMARIGQSFQGFVLPSSGLLTRGAITPGGMYSLPWKGETRPCTYLVISNLESSFRDLPVYAIPITIVGGRIQPGKLKLRHLSKDRFRDAHKIGQASPELLAWFRQGLIADLGFSLPARRAGVAMPA